MSEPSLKPCPFCGGEPALDGLAEFDGRWVICQDCGASHNSTHTDDEAIERWNTRAQPEPATHPELPALEEDAVHGRCAGYVRLFVWKHKRDPYPQEVWDAALALTAPPAQADAADEWSNMRCQYGVCDEASAHDPKCKAWAARLGPVGFAFRDRFGNLLLAQTDPPPEGSFPVYATPAQADPINVAAQETSKGESEGRMDKPDELAPAAATPSPAQADAADAMRLVPLAFLQGVLTLAHNYSLNAVAPDYYHGVECDAFADAYRRCGQALAKLRAMVVTPPAQESGDSIG